MDGSPGAILSAVLQQLWSQSKTLTEQLLPCLRPGYDSGQSDSAFRLLEYFEARIVEDTMEALIARHPTQSLVWLHDGFLIAPPPTEHMIRQIEKTVLSKHQLFFNQTWFKITPLAAQYEAYTGNLRNTASAPRTCPRPPNAPAVHPKTTRSKGPRSYMHYPIGSPCQTAR